MLCVLKIVKIFQFLHVMNTSYNQRLVPSASLFSILTAKKEKNRPRNKVGCMMFAPALSVMKTRPLLYVNSSKQF